MKEKRMTRRKFLKFAGASLAVVAFSGCSPSMAEKASTTEKSRASYGKDGSKYVPYEERTGAESVVYFTRDLSAAGLVRIFDRVKDALGGKVAIKVHTGEPHGPNIIPRPWVKELMASRLPDATIIETNTYYGGGRYTTEDHRETLAVNGWDFAPVDITDEHGTALLPVPGGKWFKEMSVGKGMLDYDSFLALTHFNEYVKLQHGFMSQKSHAKMDCFSFPSIFRQIVKINMGNNRVPEGAAVLP